LARAPATFHDGGGLEWLPTGLYSTAAFPIVTSLYPLWDQPKLARDVEAGRYFLPNAPTGGRETLVTSPLNAEPQQLLPMPRPSGWHVWAAVFTAGFFLLLTVQAYAASLISGALAIFCVLRWCWFLDHPARLKTVEVGGGIRVPTYITGPASHGWWAMVITLIVAGMVLAMAVFSYVFLWSRAPRAWLPPPAQIWLMAIAGLNLAGGALACGWTIDLATWRQTGLAPQVSAQGAIVYALLSWQGFFVAVAALMTFYVGLRWSFGYITADRRATVQLVGLFLGYCAVQGLVGALLPRLFPGG
jgi:cytochrome c oxidase subunit I+III